VPHRSEVAAERDAPKIVQLRGASCRCDGNENRFVRGGHGKSNGLAKRERSASP
jgi:hypothetical protein